LAQEVLASGKEVGSVPEPGNTAHVDESGEDQIARDRLLLRARRGLAVHGAVTGVVCVLIIALNVARAPELIWWPLPIVGMLLGFCVHWWYGYDRLEEQLRHGQGRGRN
jgi:hypothetical protein